MVKRKWLRAMDEREWCPPCGYCKGRRTFSCLQLLGSLGLSQKLAEEWVVEPVTSSSCAGQQACFNVALADHNEFNPAPFAQKYPHQYFKRLQISVELSLFQTPKDKWPEVRCISEPVSVVLAPEFAGDECEEEGMAERFAVQPFGKLLEIEAGSAKHRANIFGCLLKTERLQRALVVEADSRFGETANP